MRTLRGHPFAEPAPDCGQLPLGRVFKRKLHLRLSDGGHDVAVSAPGLVGFGPAYLDRGPIRGCGPSVDQALISRREVSTYDADRVELIDAFRYGEEIPDRAKGVTPKVHVDAGHDDTLVQVRKSIHDSDDFRIQELRLINRYDLSPRLNPFSDLGRL